MEPKLIELIIIIGIPYKLPSIIKFLSEAG